MTTISFASEPAGEVTFNRNNAQVLRKPPVSGASAREVSKTVFSAEALRKFPNKGYWFEVRVEDFSGASISTLGVGFTATDPSTIRPAPAEGEAPQPLPGCPEEIPKTFVVGYARCAYWDGERVEIDPLCANVKPFKSFAVGALATIQGSLEIYIDRKLVLEFAPDEHGLNPMPVDESLWAVFDLSGGIKKASLLTDSVPPSPEEMQATPEPDAGGAEED